jgi:NDP-sugar pyrophosphorylase family protein
MLHERGIRRAVLCVGYLGQMIQDQFGTRACGITLDYSFDGERPLGTGGAIKRALPGLGREFFILYGDSYLPTEFAPVAQFFQRSGKLGLMTVYHNQDRYDVSNVLFRNGEILHYGKNLKLPEMEHIDYGLSMLQASVFDAFGAKEVFDLAEVMGKLVRERQLAGFEVHQRFYQIGSPTGLLELETILKDP